MTFALHNEKKTDMNKPFIFVSYSSEDKDVVLEDVRQLRSLGVNIWIDTQMRVGRNWQDEAFSAMRAVDCMAVLFYVSEYSLTSENVLAELRYSREKLVKITHPGGLLILPIQLIGFGEGNNLTNWFVKHILVKYKSEEEKIFNVHAIKEEFLDDGGILIHNGTGRHDEEYYRNLLGLVEPLGVINMEPADKEKTKAPVEKTSTVKQKATAKIEEAAAVQEIAAVKSGSNSGNESKAITCTLYGKNYSFASQSDFMIGVFTKVIERHPDKIKLLPEKLTCVALVDYEKPENRKDMKSNFNTCKTIYINNTPVCIGTNYGLSRKEAQIRILLELCGEDSGVLKYGVSNEQAEEIAAEEELVIEPFKGEGVNCRIYGKKYVLKNQSDYMVKVFEAVMKRHPDKLQQLADKLFSVAKAGKDKTYDEKVESTCFRTGGAFLIGTQEVRIGTSLNLASKFNQIEKLLDICGEDPSQFQFDIK